MNYLKQPVVYLAGPMRGYKLYNFPAFDEYRDKLCDAGIDVISPADLDRDAGFDPEKDLDYTKSFTKEDCIIRDVEAICRPDVDAVVLMPGWEKSSGVMVELALSLFLKKPCYQLKEL